MSFPPPNVEINNKRIYAGILAILFGAFGLHKFILGYTGAGLIMLFATLSGIFLCGIPSGIMGTVGLIEGILYLTKPNYEFYQTYVVGNKPWF